MNKTAIISLSLLPTLHLSAITWDGGGGDGLWSNPLNWDGDVLPTSDDNVVIDNATVTVDSPASAKQISLGNSGSSTVTLNVNSTLSYFDQFGASDWGVVGDTISVNVGSGGLIDGGEASRIEGTATVTIGSGGMITGVYRQRIDPTILLDGGVYRFSGSSTGNPIGTYALNNGSISGASGTLIFTATGDGLNLNIQPSSGVTFDVDQLTIQMEMLDGYTPQIGDSFDLFNNGGAFDLGDGSNIASETADGNWLITWDTSQWNPGTALGKGVISIADVSSIPEPETYAGLLGLAALTMLALRRRK
ncbi:PEP-CTERM sorting domain-containing protein [Cerasicoccus frondis]|uniref:PEP-CTERM sorting domain-containing protein n=1 Tax=Cerasicoccus frondis TaxID=490090 RepID=UPI0028525730|nr:PEP-CTERM sorting domain-containing protein [Cerasicoccus frondis]